MVAAIVLLAVQADPLTDALATWRACVEVNAQRSQAAGQSAEVVARNAVALCRGPRDAAVVAARRAQPDIDPKQAEAFADSIEQGLRAEATQRVKAARAGG